MLKIFLYSQKFEIEKNETFLENREQIMEIFSEYNTREYEDRIYFYKKLDGFSNFYNQLETLSYEVSIIIR